MAQHKMYSGGNSKSRRGWVSTSTKSQRSTFSQRQSQNYNSYPQSNYQDNYYDYTSGYVGDYRYAPAMTGANVQYEQRQVPPTYYHSTPDYDAYSSSRTATQIPHPSSIPQRLHSIPTPAIAHPQSAAPDQSYPPETEGTSDVEFSTHESDAMKQGGILKFEEGYVNQPDTRRGQGLQPSSEKSKSYYNARTGPSHQYYQPQTTFSQLQMSSSVEYFPHQTPQHPVTQTYYPPTNEYQMSYPPTWPQHQAQSTGYPTYQYPQGQFGESRGYSHPQHGHSSHQGDYGSSGYGRPYPPYY